MPNLKRYTSNRKVTIKPGQVFGIGSLKWQPRTVVALEKEGTVVVYEVGATPGLDGALRGRSDGSVCSCSRRAFILWLAEIRKELFEIHGRIR